ncbi:MAG: HisA/HisF-related TIM barrel protein [Gammaproteobacteria bacterium]|nr:HisA/HisF-related TIM barrel protein [Gammaproteobacteria bacterium]
MIYEDGFFTQSRNFRLQRVGDIQWLEKNYQFQKIAFSLDELVVLNASRSSKSFSEFSNIVSLLRKNIFIPVSVGGGIRKMEDAEILFKHGADKIVLNTVLFTNAELVKKLVCQYGSQSIIASVDYRKINDQLSVFIENGEKMINLSLRNYVDHISQLKIGELYLNSIDKDGTGFGYDIETINEIKKQIHIPFIIAGGAGNEGHLIEGLKTDSVSAVATANLFNFMGDGLLNARNKILELKVNLPSWIPILN